VKQLGLIISKVADLRIGWRTLIWRCKQSGNGEGVFWLVDLSVSMQREATRADHFKGC
jgi:hypothetical protein